MMKRNLIYVLAAIAMASCQDKRFSVSCTMPEDANVADSTWCYICSYESGTRDKAYTDSAQMIGGKVTIEGEIDGSVLRRFEVGYKTRNYANFILEAGDITIDIEKRTSKGTILNDKLADFLAWAEDTDGKAMAEYEKIQKDASLSSDDKQEQSDLLWSDYSRTTIEYAHNIVAENKGNGLGQYIFWQGIAYNEFITPERYKQELKSAGEFIANYKPVTAITKRFEALEQTQPGADYVDFTIEHGNIDNTSVKLSDYVGKGKIILVDMWASWCGPCRRAMPYIRNVYEKYAGDKFDVVSIAVWDERQSSIEAIPQLGMTWNQIVEAESIPTELYGVNGIPHLMLIGADGKILARGLSETALELWVSSEIKKLE
ncbi:MAG: AhpC/TSA family protein [Bacteroidales bacterium]|nr:AhpC/TSA family protein [Bacteroidales bacterium]